MDPPRGGERDEGLPHRYQIMRESDPSDFQRHMVPMEGKEGQNVKVEVLLESGSVKWGRVEPERYHERGRITDSTDGKQSIAFHASQNGHYPKRWGIPVGGEVPREDASTLLAARVERLFENGGQFRERIMLLRLKLDEGEPTLLSLRDEAARVSATIRTEDRAVLYVMQSERESITKSMAEKGVPLYFSIEAKREFMRKEKREERRTLTDRIPTRKGG